MHFKMASAISFNLDLSKILLSGNGLTAKLGPIMAVGDTHVFPGFLTPVIKQLFFPKPLTTFLTCFSRGEQRKYASNKFRTR